MADELGWARLGQAEAHVSKIGSDPKKKNLFKVGRKQNIFVDIFQVHKKHRQPII